MAKKRGGDNTGYTVGYGKPPRSGQFKKGQSGNPKGRRKNSLNRRTILLAALQEPVVIKVNGKKKTMSKGELAFQRFVQKVIETGDVRYVRFLEELMREYGIGNDPVELQQKYASTVIFIPHNGRGPVKQPILKEKPGRPVSEWEVDETYDPATGKKREE